MLMKTVYDFTVKDRQGQAVSLKDYEGKVLLIVNTATGCGFTPHYEPLEAMYKELKEKGLEILDFPCNQFANQAPGSDDEIHQFCTLKYGTDFPQFAKIDVNGENADPLFAFLATEKPFAGFDKGLKNAALNKLAQFLTGKECSLERHASNGWGPANLEAQADEAVLNDPILAAVYAQKVYGQVQLAISGAWWNIGNVIADEAKDATDEEGLKQVLVNYENKINESLKLDANALLFVGAWNGWNNADEADTYYFKDGTLTLDVPESDYMGGRIVKPADWGTDKGFAQVTTGAELIKDLGADNPDNNIVFAEPGNYTVTWDGEAITIVKN